MSKFLFAIIALLCWQNIALAQYTVNSIPDSLKENAHAVIRNKEVTLHIKSKNEYELTTKMRVSILNRKASAHDLIILNYRDGDKVEIKRAHLYDVHGRKRKSMKQSDILERSAITDNYEDMEYEDGKIKAFSFNTEKYPHTIEYETVQRIKNTLNFPEWAAVATSHMASEKALFTVVFPNDYEPRFSYPDNWQPSKTSDNKNTTYVWQAKNIKAIKEVPLMPGHSTIFPTVSVAPNTFTIENHTGKMDTWSDFSRFNYELIKGRDQLSEAELHKIKTISEQYNTTTEKVTALYKYMQNKTRYVSIQLGIGGWQPFEASFVSEKGYGDCKALSNYMHSILKAANITSYYAVVDASGDPNLIREDFPINRFTHAILCVPNQQDTIWLECTSQELPAGYLGMSTTNRKALLIVPNGGKLVATQKLLASDNVKKRIVQALIDSLGNYDLEIQTDYKGVRQDALFYKIKKSTNTALKKDIARSLHLNNFKITSLDHEVIEERIPTVREKLKVITTNPLGNVKKRIFVPADFGFHQEDWSFLINNEQRTIPFNIAFGLVDIDTSIIHLPPEYLIERLPQVTNISNTFGTYLSEIVVDSTNSNQLTVLRKLELFANEYPAGQYEEFQKFIRAVQKGDNQKIILVHK